MLHYVYIVLGLAVVAFIVTVIFDNFYCWLWDLIRKATGLETLSQRLERMEKTLEEIRDQPQQEKLRRHFEKAHDFTLKEVRMLKKGRTIGLIVQRYDDRAHPFQVFEYKHDHLDEMTEVSLSGGVAARIAHGRCSSYYYEQEQILENKENFVPLPPEQQWGRYEFLVGDSRSETRRHGHIKCLSNSAAPQQGDTERHLSNSRPSCLGPPEPKEDPPQPTASTQSAAS